MPRTATIENAVVGSTSVMEYTGNPLDIIHVSAIYPMPGAVALQNLEIGLVKNFHVRELRNTRMSGLLAAVPVIPAATHQTDNDGLFRLVLFTEMLPAEARIQLTVTARGS